MVTGGAAGKKRMAVSSLLETRQPNVYIIGDLLSPAYLETTDFDGDPVAFQEVKHRGNIKAAMRDGVLVAKVAAQKITGKKEFDIELDFETESKQEPLLVKKDKSVSVVTMIVEQAMIPTEKPVQPVGEPQACIVRMLAGNVEENEFPVTRNGVTTVGRKFCDIVFPDDDMLSDRHASILHGIDGYSLRDDGSATGIFLKAREAVPLEVISGDLVRMGRQFLLFRNENGTCSFTHYDQSGKQVNQYPLSDKTIVLGRDAPDVTLDKSDMTLSRRHLSIVLKEGKMMVKDLKSVNGSYLKVRSAVSINDGEILRLGRQALKFTLERDNVVGNVRISTKPPVPAVPKTMISQPVPAPAPVVKPPATPMVSSAAPAGNIVTIKNVGKGFEFKKGETICEIAEHNEVKIVAECHAGICGSDPIRVHSGKENCNSMSDDEKGTLEDICNLTPGDCRLACMLKPTGPVEVEILKS